MNNSTDTVLGIDLGTTFSVIAALDLQGRPFTLKNSEGDSTTPSVVFLDRDGAIVGREAVKAAEFEPDRVATFPKRDVGQTRYHQAVRGTWFRPEVLQALILTKLRRDAEATLGPVKRVVITVPAYFNEPRRKATQDAARIAGLEVLDILNEPTAAAIAFGVQRGFLTDRGAIDKPETVLVYDLGGGTFDVTLMKIDKDSFVTVATDGDMELGGIDFDERLIGIIAERFMAEHHIDPRSDLATYQRLRREAEEVKRTLTSRNEANLLFAHEGYRLRTVITRDEFESVCGDLLDRTQLTVRKVLRDAGLNYGDLTRLLVVGGSSRMPMVSKMLQKETGFPIDRLLSVDEAVAQGAAIYANHLARRESQTSTAADAGFKIRNVNSHTLGVLGKDKSTGRARRQLMIARNTPLPATKTQRFTTFQDNQPSVAVNVVEGGDDSGQGSTAIGRCTVHDLPPNLPRGTSIDVTFDYLENGRLLVKAFVPAANKEAQLAITRAAGMSEDLLQAWTACVQTGLPDDQKLPVDLVPPTDADVAPSPKPTGSSAAKQPTPKPAPSAPESAVAPVPTSQPVSSVIPPAVQAVLVPVAIQAAAAAQTPEQSSVPATYAGATEEDDNPLASLFGGDVGTPTAAPSIPAAVSTPIPQPVADVPSPAPAPAPAQPTANDADDQSWLSGPSTGHADHGFDLSSLFGNE